MPKKKPHRLNCDKYNTYRKELILSALKPQIISLNGFTRRFVKIIGKSFKRSAFNRVADILH